MSAGRFLSDIDAIPRKTREHLSYGAVASNYQGDRQCY
jgi:hypothetical protein